MDSGCDTEVLPESLLPNLPNNGVYDIVVEVDCLVDDGKQRQRSDESHCGGEPIKCGRKGTVKHGRNEQANRKIRKYVLPLADVRKEPVASVNLVPEPVVIEHPNGKDVLAVVPDVQYQPPMIDVAN